MATIENEELTPRCQTVLRLVVSEYIKTAMPVGSKAISENYDLGVSPATVRHEMAVLEEKGFLTHPHTSAGRIPTEDGYRYFVEKLMREGNLPLTEQRTINHQFHQARLDLEQWMRLAASVLAHKANSAAVVTVPKTSTSQIRHVELVSIRDLSVLLILVLQTGIVKQQVLSLETPIEQNELSQIARRLSHHWANLDKNGVAVLAQDLAGFELQVAQVVLETMKRVDSRASSEVYRDGLLNVLGEPEFSSSTGAQQIVRALEERQFIESMFGQVIQRGGLQIIIGGEGQWEDLSEVSVVLARYGLDEQATGALGVLGPIRMQYGRAVSVVRYMSHLMTDLVSDYYSR